jgi:hypothetical protein
VVTTRFYAGPGSALVAPLEGVVGFAGGVLLLLGVLEIFKEIGIEDGGGDFVVAGGPLAEVDGAAALGAEGNFGGVEGDKFFADGAVKWFGHGDYSSTILLGWQALRAGWGFPRTQACRHGPTDRRRVKPGRRFVALTSISTTSSNRSKVTF